VRILLSDGLGFDKKRDEDVSLADTEYREVVGYSIGNVVVCVNVPCYAFPN
jgi:hypothetical protein